MTDFSQTQYSDHRVAELLLFLDPVDVTSRRFWYHAQLSIFSIEHVMIFKVTNNINDIIPCNKLK